MEKLFIVALNFLKRPGSLNLKSVQRTFSVEISLKEIYKGNPRRKSSKEIFIRDTLLIVPFWITLIIVALSKNGLEFQALKQHPFDQIELSILKSSSESHSMKFNEFIENHKENFSCF